MKTQNLLVSMAIAVLPLMVHFDPARADALDEIHARGTLRVAVPQDFAPFGSVGSSMHLEGVDIEVSALVAKALGAKLEMVPVTMENRISALREKKVDLIISALGKNAEREKQIDFSQSYSPYNNSVYGVAAIKVDGPADLAGKTIGVTRSTLEDLMITKSAPPSATIKRYDDNNSLLSAYLSTEVALIGTGDFAAAKIADILPPGAPNKPILKYVIHESACHIGLNKDEPKLLAKIDGVLTEAKKNGELNAIMQKWLHVPLPQKMAQSTE